MVCAGSLPNNLKMRASKAANTPITIRTGVLCIILCFALGIANIFHFDIIILWSVICLYVSLLACFVESASQPAN